MYDIAYYVSTHGYGHGSRSCDIVRALRRLRPELRIVMISGLAESFLRSRLLDDAVGLRQETLDIGMVQIDAIRVDLQATLTRMESIHAGRRAKAEEEARFLATNRVSLVVSDIPAIPIEAARLGSIPAVAVSNFGWDWIYSEFAERESRWRPIVDAIAEAYGRSELLLRLPFYEPMAAFPRIYDLPLLASPARKRRAEVATLTGARQDRVWVLLAFSSLPWDERILARLERLTDYEFFTAPPPEWQGRNIHTVDRGAIPFPDLLATSDCVVSKPGFGIVSECVANAKPLLYVERTDFREYHVLEEAIRQYATHQHLPARDLYAGDLGEGLDALRSRPGPVRSMPNGGDEVAARKLVEFL